jgi:hypothetical protein
MINTHIVVTMTDTDFCDQIEQAIKNLLDQGRTEVKAHEIADETEIGAGDFQSPGQFIGWNLGFGACGDLDDVEWEIVQNENDSNCYRLHYR